MFQALNNLFATIFQGIAEPLEQAIIENDYFVDTFNFIGSLLGHFFRLFNNENVVNIDFEAVLPSVISECVAIAVLVFIVWLAFVLFRSVWRLFTNRA